MGHNNIARTQNYHVEHTIRACEVGLYANIALRVWSIESNIALVWPLKPRAVLAS